MDKLLKNRFINAWARMLFIGGTFHVTLTAIGALLQGNIDHVNAFTILGVSIFFPDLGTGTTNLILGYVLIVIFYLSVFHFFTKDSHS